MKRSAVSSGRPRYPRPTCTPPMNSSPGTPWGTGRSATSSSRIRVFATGRPMGTERPSAPRTHSCAVTSTAASVGP
ncbi:hypothetical protein COSO111634_20825 [Corallococcus soli]